MQHFRVKIFVNPGSAPDLAAAIPVFHRWIQRQALPELMIDVADYRHVPNGPGVLLVCHDAHYSLDSADGRLGLLYNRRTALEGSTGDKLRAAIAAAASAARKLESEPEFAGSLSFNQGALEISVNDRALAPNTEETWRSVRSDFAAVLDGFQLSRRGDPRALFTVQAAKQASPGER